MLLRQPGSEGPQAPALPSSWLIRTESDAQRGGKRDGLVSLTPVRKQSNNSDRERGESSPTLQLADIVSALLLLVEAVP